MAIRYVDLVNGNDANNGTTFALRKKTINSASSGLTGGDTVRIMKSSDPTSLGSCTWSNSTRTVILPTAATAHINACDSGWTVTTNVTATYPTTATDLKYGSAHLQLAIAAGFTTGKVAYAPCSTVDLSGYQQISLFFRNNIAIAANTLYIDLCSDLTGDVPVVSFVIPAKGAHSQYISPFTFDYGANLPNNINSIAFRAAIDPGALTIYVDHIIACKNKSSDDSITLNSIIGLNTESEPEWFPIRNINGTTIELDTATNWVGSAGSITTYKLEPIRLQDIIATMPTGNNNSYITGWNSLSNGAVNTGPIRFEFGYDTTDMSTQTGFTVVDFQTYSGRSTTSEGEYLLVDKIVNIRTNQITAAITGSTPTYLEYGTVHYVQPISFSFGGSLATLIFDKMFVTAFENSSTNAAERVIGNVLSCKYNRYKSLADFNFYLYSRYLNIKNVTSHGLYNEFGNINEGLIDTFNSNHTGNLTNAPIELRFPIVNLRIKNFHVLNSGSITNVVILNVSSEVNMSIGKLTLVNSTVSSIFSTSSNYSEQQVFIQDYNNTGVGMGKFEYGSLTTTTSGTHSGTGVAWELAISGNYMKPYNRADYYKVQNFKVADIPVKANKLHTVKLWAKRGYTATKGCLFVKPSAIGIDDYVISETSGSANTWEELTITFTPTVNSIAEIYAAGQYDAANASQKYTFDDLSVTIAD